MNKTNWNTVELDGSIPTGEVLRLIDHSYEQVAKGLPKALRLKAARA
jgi:predicted DNA-binding protein (MmcQ/YjbR family)